MSQELLRVREFAQMCGCTPQNVYGHLRTYAEELEGHVVKGRGRQGVLLDDFAQEFIRSVMYPKEVAPAAAAEEILELRQQLLQLGLTNTNLASRLATVEGERDKAILEAGQNQRLLMASQEAEEKLAADLDEAEAKARQLEEELAAAKEREARLMARGFWARLTNKGVD